MQDIKSTEKLVVCLQTNTTSEKQRKTKETNLIRKLIKNKNSFWNKFKQGGENCKILMKESEKDTTEQKDISCSQIIKINISNISTLPKAFSRFNAVL